MARAHAEQVADTPPVRRRFTTHEYDRMGEAGILREDERIELLDGEIIEMSPIGTPRRRHPRLRVPTTPTLSNRGK